MGGTSSINGMVYIRGQSRDDDGWRQQGCVGWAWDDVLPYFKKSEDHARGADEAHGVGGELRVEDLRVEDLRVSWEHVTSALSVYAHTNTALAPDRPKRICCL